MNHIIPIFKLEITNLLKNENSKLKNKEYKKRDTISKKIKQIVKIKLELKNSIKNAKNNLIPKNLHKNGK